jgi:hypothetical protein
MTGAVDIGREACERLADDLQMVRWPADQGCKMREDAAHTLRALRAALDAAERERDEFQASFDLAWDADMRGIKRWQAAHPGKELTWPGRDKLVAWLLSERDAADATGYARGVRDAANLINRIADEADGRAPDGGPFGLVGRYAESARGLAKDVLALLPATDATKE